MTINSSPVYIYIFSGVVMHSKRYIVHVVLSVSKARQELCRKYPLVPKICNPHNYAIKMRNTCRKFGHLVLRAKTNNLQFGIIHMQLEGQ